MEEQRQLAFQSGMIAFLTKPVKLQELIAAIQPIYDGHRQ
jgi:CheY-like chemotaxis protein